MVFNWLLWGFAHIITSLVNVWRKYQSIWLTACQSTEAYKRLCFRRFDSFKYLTTLRSYISPCQRATTLILITLYNPSFHLWNHQKHLWARPNFCLGCLLKSATVTSFPQLHLSRNSGSSLSLDQINLHFLLFILDDWSRKLTNVKNFRDFS